VLATGLHSGLLLPCGEGRVVEYGYGEWGWYARDESGWWRAPVIALVPSQGAIGRRYLREADLEAMGRKYGGGTIAPVRVPRAAAAELLAKLDAEFAAGGEPYLNVAYDMTFVRCPERFHLFHECHDETAAWLRELGCDVPDVADPRRARGPRRSLGMTPRLAHRISVRYGIQSTDKPLERFHVLPGGFGQNVGLLSR
jgi:hypothetical protein